TIGNGRGHRTFFVQLQQGAFTWWHPIDIEQVERVQLVPAPAENKSTLRLALRNRGEAIRVRLLRNGRPLEGDGTAPGCRDGAAELSVPARHVAFGRGRVAVLGGQDSVLTQADIACWEVGSDTGAHYAPVPLDGGMSAGVDEIVAERDLSPRPAARTL